MFKLTRKKFYILLFSILWLITAFSSFFHAVEFFELSNVTWMGIILAMAFEIGQASVLMSILTSPQDRKKYTPWILMCILTLVQIIGNVYSSYKYIMLNSPENLKYFKEPIFIWTQLPDAEATVIITYVSAAILPIVALLMTSMITNYLSDQSEETNTQVTVSENEQENTHIELNNKDERNDKNEQEIDNLNATIDEKDEEIDNLIRNEKIDVKPNETETSEDKPSINNEAKTSEDNALINNEAETSEDNASINIEMNEENNDVKEVKKDSHFINL